ncbi:MAG: 16S rRNA (uracil(1498)-N(3))-methyltransferase [Clostridia bacterium]|nr:16S rRNA (uracil(1498)-N(3))-methyltransferase [Clostridia bacterium]
MKEKRYYVNSNLTIGQNITLEGEEFHHLANVMRTRVGDSICLFNGNGKFYFGIVKNISKKQAEIFIEKEENSSAEPSINLTIFQALAKGDKLSLITQKITELGATTLALFESEFCDVKGNSTKAERLYSIAISASKQCGRATILKIENTVKLTELKNKISDFDAFFVAYEAEDGRTLVDELTKGKNKLKNIAIMIGAEGGFSKNEIELLKNCGAIIVSLGKRILRTETAAIACTALAMQILEN